MEGRALLAGLAFNFTLDDPGGLFAPYPALLPDLQAAGAVLSKALDGKGMMDVTVRPDNTVPRASGGVGCVVDLRVDPTTKVVEHGTLDEALTGIDPNGADPDIIIQINTADYLSHVLWLDPNPGVGPPAIPADRTDFVTVAEHELVHALGISTYRAVDGPTIGQFPIFGTPPRLLMNNFDALTAFGTGANAGILYFQGTKAEALYGGPVPLTSVGAGQFLTSQNFAHVGNPAGMPGADLIPDLMNGVVFQNGQRYSLSPLDVAILQDLGWTTPSAPTLSLSPAGDQSVPEGSTLVVHASASGGPSPLTYSLDPGAPAGAQIDPHTGVLTWTPADGPASAQITVRVTDSASPPHSVTKTFLVNIVNVAPEVVRLGVDAVVIQQGTPLVGAGTIRDPGGDSYTAMVDYGDGSGPQTLGLNLDGSFLLYHTYSHIYSDLDWYGVTVSATDSDGAVRSSRFTIGVFPRPDPTGPALQVAQAVTSRRGITGIRLTFSEALDPGSAGSLSNYTLVLPGRDNKFGTRDDRRVALKSAALGAGGNVVTLTLRNPMPKTQAARLTLKSTTSGGLADVAHNLLDGNRDGLPGGDAIATLKRGRLTLASVVKIASHRGHPR